MQQLTPPPKLCYTAAGILIQNDKVLLVKHKKLGIWLNPGGHIEEGELPHQAAEREYFEETGVTVAAYCLEPLPVAPESYFVPSPILTNVHWVCKENYERRQEDPDHYQPLPQWKKGCEQHVSFLFLVKPTAEIMLKHDPTESDGIGWFTRAELENIETLENIKLEVAEAFKRIS